MPRTELRDVGVVAVVADEMESGRRDVHHEASEKLGGVEGFAAASSRPLVAVEGEPRLEAEALEGQRRPQQVGTRRRRRCDGAVALKEARLRAAAGDSLETIMVLGPNRDRIVNRETSVTRLPGVQKLDPVLVEREFGRRSSCDSPLVVITIRPPNPAPTRPESGWHSDIESRTFYGKIFLLD